jgi:pilus assembly protein Flp/PilA
MGEGFFIMMQFIQQFVRDEEGQDVVEYALVIGLVALSGTVGLGLLSGDIGTLLGNVGGQLTAAVAAA